VPHGHLLGKDGKVGPLVEDHDDQVEEDAAEKEELRYELAVDVQRLVEVPGVGLYNAN